MDPTELKDTNPKDAIGSTKLPLHLVPDSALAYLALAFCEGATKYGAFNWRVAGVRASIYMSAARRHMAKFWNGEWADPKTSVPHLASAMACMAIILDAKLANKLTDDRPPAVDVSGLIDSMSETVQHLQELHKDMNPRHWTIADSDPLLGILNEGGDEGGFIDHDPSIEDKPVGDDVRVDAILRNGEVMEGRKAGSIFWDEHPRPEFQIVKWRLAR